ncbi:hypothetical protein EC973_005160 [Apophysomyces ossiformis]|uniref:Uncharacterized protein n=1 Tax=Apophysomyces ossiformis TaxID=679940 RepID=A0A8H7BPD6_9FUNG|nr:hypothetical protein EC973_005160 [Apophysomyces ossiformis]
MLYRVVRMYDLQSVGPEGGDMFRESSHWRWLYERVKSGNEDRIDWSTVIDFQTDVVMDLQGRTGQKEIGNNPAAFFTATLNDGIHLSDDEN